MKHTAYNGHKLDEWINLLERTQDTLKFLVPEDHHKAATDLKCEWVSYRGQTLARTGLIVINLWYVGYVHLWISTEFVSYQYVCQ